MLRTFNTQTRVGACDHGGSTAQIRRCHWRSLQGLAAEELAYASWRSHEDDSRFW
jgi:hypothetical protein